VPTTEIDACDIEARFILELGHRAMLSSQHLFGCAKSPEALGERARPHCVWCIVLKSNLHSATINSRGAEP